MPRLFTAFLLPEAVVDHLSDLELNMYGARWVDPDDYHVTLRFFGDVEGHVADDIMAGLGAVHERMFEARVTGLGCFGGDKPRTLTAEIGAGPGLADLQRATERVARSAGLPPERRNYSPHVTLARLDGTRPETVARFIQSFGKARLEPFPVDSFVLMSAKPGSGGGPYVVEETFTLARSPWGTAHSAAD